MIQYQNTLKLLRIRTLDDVRFRGSYLMYHQVSNAGITELRKQIHVQNFRGHLEDVSICVPSQTRRS